MVPFTYRTEIESDSPVIRAAYVVARKAHLESGQMRGKGGMSYFVHPIMVHDLLRHFGETNDIALACALLHDAREDGPEYKNNPEAMYQDLLQALKNENVHDAPEIADYMNRVCGELTNDRNMSEGKQTWQIEHAGRISLIACKIKLFDQMASILDNIMMPDDPGSKKGGKKWALKALAVVKAIASERPQLEYYRDVFKVLFKYDMNLLDAADEKAAVALRSGFVWDTAMQEANRLFEMDAVPVTIKENLLHPRSQLAARGVLQVGFDAQGKIVEYACLCNPQAGKDESRNETAIAFMGAIETSSTSRRVNTGSREVLETRLVRVNTIKPPLDAQQFVALALQSDAIERSFSTAIVDKARALTPGPKLP